MITQTLTMRSQLNRLQAQQNDSQTLERQADSERRRTEELLARLNQENQQRTQSGESLRAVATLLGCVYGAGRVEMILCDLFIAPAT